MVFSPPRMPQERFLAFQATPPTFCYAAPSRGHLSDGILGILGRFTSGYGIANLKLRFGLPGSFRFGSFGILGILGRFTSGYGIANLKLRFGLPGKGIPKPNVNGSFGILGILGRFTSGYGIANLKTKGGKAHRLIRPLYSARGWLRVGQRVQLPVHPWCRHLRLLQRHQSTAAALIREADLEQQASPHQVHLR